MQTPPAALLEGAALFLDFDGTLVELAETPGAIRVPAALPPLLRSVSRRLKGRLGIISGRAIADIETHMDCSGIALSGSHGLELRLADGDEIPLTKAVDLSNAREEITVFAAATPGLLVEEKPRSIALHYRQAPQAAEKAQIFLFNLASRTGLSVQAGKMVLELRPAGADKGDALRAFMAQPEFAGTRPIFVGDDLTDEDAFEAAAAMGGAGILVGEARPSAASWRLPDVESVSLWLNGAL